jgi:hypothetical protein
VKKNLLLLIIVSAVYFSASAQGSKKNEHLFKSSFGNNKNDRIFKNQKGGNDNGDRLARDLTNAELSADQRNSIDSVERVFDDKRQALKKDPSLSKDQRKGKMQDLKKEENSIINTFLTKKQKKEIRKEHEKKDD